MNTQEFANLLNGRQYRSEITSEEEALAKENDLIVFFSYSDDTAVLCGAIDENLSAWDGCEIYFTKTTSNKIKLFSEEEYEEVRLSFLDFDIDFKTVKVNFVWSPEELDCSFLVETDLPHHKFDILEGEDLYCRGIVVNKQDILNAL